MVVLQHTLLKRFKDILLVRHLAWLDDADCLYDYLYPLNLAKPMEISAPEGFVKTKGVEAGFGWRTFICSSLVPKSIYTLPSGRKSEPNRSGD